MITQLFDRRHLWLGTAVVALPLMFPLVRPGITVAALIGAALLTAGAWFTNEEPARSPLNWPMILLLVAVSGGAVVSSWPSDAFEKWTGVVLGVLVVHTALRSAGDERRIWCGVGFNVLLATGLIAVGAVSTNWIDKLPFLAGVTQALPRMAIVRGTQGVQPNALGATILMVLPLLIALAGSAWAEDLVTFLRQRPRPVWIPGASTLRAATRGWLVALLALLLLTQSRGSWVSLGVTLLVMVAIQRRLVRWLVILGAPVAAVAAIFVFSSAGALAMQQPGSAGLSLAGRYELWARAIEAIRDVPLTGFGLNAFHHIVHDWYPLVLLPAEVDITHAHNVFLQIALDAGLPALVAYVSLLLVVTLLTAQIMARGQLRHRALALGLFGNVCAVQVFGLTDAIALGAKVGVLMWSSIGLLGALHRSVCVPPVK